MDESMDDQPGFSAKKVRRDSPGTPKEEEVVPTWDPLVPVPPDIIDHLTNDEEWDFDVIKMESLTWKRPLTFLGRSLFGKMNVAQSLRVDDSTIWRWLARMEELHLTVPYHNSTHSADVLQGSVYFLQRLREKGLFRAMDEATVMVAAVIHDLQHPGRTNVSLCAEGHDLALTYNDRSVLENFHVSKAYTETLSESSINIFAALTDDDYRVVRENIIDLVLATDMDYHREHLDEFELVVQKRKEGGFDAQGVQTIARMLLKCSDIANPARNWELCSEWANRICAEFRSQTEKERQLDLAVTNDMFLTEPEDVIPRVQVGFIDTIVRDTFHVWCAFAGLPQLEEQLEKNSQTWRNMLTDSGDKTADDSAGKAE